MSKQTNGFILPSILMIGLGTLVVGLALLQSSSSIRSSIENQYYNKLASEAAEAGTDYAAFCLKDNDFEQTWGPAKGRPNLTQTTDCTGAPLFYTISSLTDTDKGIRSTFSVGDVKTGTDGTFVVSASGKIDRLSSAAGTVASYKGSSFHALSAPLIKYGAVTYGYFPNSPTTNTDGAYYAVRGSDGRYRTSGANKFGQLGNGTTTNILTPTFYNAPTSLTAVAAYSNFLSQGYNMFVLMSDGSVYGAGQGGYGQLGNNDLTANQPNPQKFQIGSDKATFVVPNGNTTYVLTDKNELYSSGYCPDGQLGQGNAGTCNNNQHPIPGKVLLPTPNASNPNTIPTDNIVTDAGSVFLRMAGGQVWGWGSNYFGQFGRTNPADTNTPLQIGSFGNNGQPKAVQIAFDGDTLYVVDDNGDVWAAGRNEFGEMCFPKSNISYPSFQKIPVPGDTVQVVTDQWTVLFRNTAGQVWGCGYNATGELGNGTTSNASDSLTRFILPAGVNAEYVYNAGLGSTSTEYNNTFVIGDDGRVYGAGGNLYGQLGTGYTSSYESYPRSMKTFDGNNVAAADIVTGLGTTIVLSTNKVYYTVGNNKYGQLGDGTTNNTSTPYTAKYLKVVSTYLF